MNKYITKSGQNLYDIALAIYGSIEGIFDLLISNKDISIGSVFSKGVELYYHQDFILNDDISQWLKDNNITVKNGNYQIINTDIKEEIKNWLLKTNSQKFTLNDEALDDPNGTMKPDLWEDNNSGIDLASETEDVSSGIIISSSTSSIVKWGNQGVTAGSMNDDLSNIVDSSFNLDTSKIDDETKQLLFDKWYSQGMIVLPLKNEDKEEYYTNMAIPKIKILQNGKISTINMQIPSNKFIAIDWGDNSKISFFHYQKETTRAAHNYDDDGEHTIVIYGHNEFTNLDFTELDGIYYALTTIYINKQFVTPYEKDNPINKLFITK